MKPTTKFIFSVLLSLALLPVGNIEAQLPSSVTKISYQISAAKEVIVTLAADVELSHGKKVRVVRRSEHQFYFSVEQDFLYIECEDGGYYAIPASQVESLRFYLKKG